MALLWIAFDWPMGTLSAVLLSAAAVQYLVLSLVVAPSADGADKPTLFMAKEKYGTDDTPVGFELLDVEKLDGGVLWLKYRVKNARS